MINPKQSNWKALEKGLKYHREGSVHVSGLCFYRVPACYLVTELIDFCSGFSLERGSDLHYFNS